jgi:hypothetical protein
MRVVLLLALINQRTRIFSELDCVPWVYKNTGLHLITVCHIFSDVLLFITQVRSPGRRIGQEWLVNF